MFEISHCRNWLSDYALKNDNSLKYLVTIFTSDSEIVKPVARQRQRVVE